MVKSTSFCLLFCSFCSLYGACGRFDHNGIIHENCTYAYFDKAGYHYEMIITYKGNINNLKLSDDVKLVKEVKDSLKHKS